MSGALNAMTSATSQNAHPYDTASLSEYNFEGTSLLEGALGGALGIGLAHISATSHLNQNRKRMLGNAMGSLLTMGAIDYARSQMHFLTSSSVFSSAFQAGTAVMPIFTASLDSVRERYQLDDDNVKFMLAMVKGTIPGSLVTSGMLMNGQSFVESVAIGAFVAYQISNRSYGA
jgi:hypothetical protein